MIALDSSNTTVSLRSRACINAVVEAISPSVWCFSNCGQIQFKGQESKSPGSERRWLLGIVIIDSSAVSLLKGERSFRYERLDVLLKMVQSFPENCAAQCSIAVEVQRH